jgi:hypothetical protein
MAIPTDDQVRELALLRRTYDELIQMPANSNLANHEYPSSLFARTNANDPDSFSSKWL